MSYGLSRVPTPFNEPIKTYAPGSTEKSTLKARMAELASEEIEIPLIIGGKEVRTGNFGESRSPHDHGKVLAKYHKAGEAEVHAAVEASKSAKAAWADMPWEARASVFLKAADLLAGPYRDTVNAATMLGQSKTAHQAEIDSACEAIDFLRFNPHYMAKMMEDQPESSPGIWNRLELRPLDGFVFAISPFNFTAIAANLPTAPAMVGNTVLWKPASSSVFSNYFLMKLFQEAGVPDGVINFLPGSGGQVGDPAVRHEDFAGIHFTGSTEVFQGIWRTVGENIQRYKCYPRIVGETGGKDFIFAHETADVAALKTAIVRGAFEYQGQKCSAASRAYIPSNVWSQLKDDLVEEVSGIKMGDVADFRNFMGAVIDRNAFDSIKGYLDFARTAAGGEILCGGTCDDSKGYFIEPTLIVASDPHFKTMEEEIFGPALTVFVYDENKYDEVLNLCDTTSPYALTGSIFANDRSAVEKAMSVLSHAAGNFYINDKPTGAVVGQQPFGGSRASGTNDKAGSALNLLRWSSPRTVKETFVPPTDYRYPSMGEE